MIVIELNEEYEDLILDNLLSYSDNYVEFADPTAEELAKALKKAAEDLPVDKKQLFAQDLNFDNPEGIQTSTSSELEKAQKAIKDRTQPIKQPTTPTKTTAPKKVPTPMGNADLIATGLVGAGLLGLGGLYATSRIRKRKRREKEG